VIGHPISADVDGDGSPDRVTLRVAGHHYGLQDAVVVETASHRLLRHDMVDVGTARYPANELLGAYDVNGDGRDEIVVFTSGNTDFHAEIVMLVRGRLQAARSRDLVPYFSAHGNACGQCTQDATCQKWKGKPRLVETESFRHSQDRRRWQAKIYDLRGTRFVKVRTFHGIEPPGAALPAEFRFDGALNCGSAHWDLSSG